MRKPKLTGWRRVLHYISGEWILIDWEIPNGGAAVFLRSLFSSTLLFLVVLSLINIADPQRSWTFSFDEFRTQLIHYLPWYGVIFAAIYTSLYARFASQWAYLANLYNSIKEAEVTGVRNKDAMAQWKAGFIEDAEMLHMECKSSFVAIIDTWLKDPKVESSFMTKTIAGDLRLKLLQSNLSFSIELVRKSYLRQHSGSRG